METGKLTFPIIGDKTLDKILNPTYTEKQKALEAFRHLSNIPYQEIKKTTLDQLFQTTSCFHPIWNIETIKMLMEKELERSIIVVSDPTYKSHYIDELTQILEEMFVNQRLTPEQFLNAHIVYRLSNEEQLKLIEESEVAYTDVLQSVSDYCDPAPIKSLKYHSHRDRAIIISKTRIFKRITQLQKYKK